MGGELFPISRFNAERAKEQSRAERNSTQGHEEVGDVVSGRKLPNELSGGNSGVLCGTPFLRDLRVFRCLHSRCRREFKE